MKVTGDGMIVVQGVNDVRNMHRRIDAQVYRVDRGA